MKKATIAIAAFAFYALGCRGQDLLTLDQAVAMALDNNRGIRTSTLDILKAQENLKANWTHVLPSFSLNALGAQQLQSFDFTLQKGVLGSYPGTGPLPANDVHLKTPREPTGVIVGKVSQPLTSLIRIRRNLDTLRTAVELAREQTRVNKQTVVRDVKHAYYAIQQVESGLESARETVALYKELGRLTENYVAGKVVLQSELLEVMTHLAKAEQSASLLDDQHSAAREQLNQLLGRDVLIPFQVEPVLDTAAARLDLDTARRRALAQRPEIRQAELRRVHAEEDLRAKKAESIPDVAAEVNTLNFLNYGQFFPSHSNSVGFSVTWEPFDWGRKRHEAAERQYSVGQARNSQQDAINAVIVDINDKYRRVRQSEIQLRVARLAQQTAVESLRVTKNKFAVDAVLLKDVLQGQLNLEQSNSDYQQALISVCNSRADFERALGEDQ